MTDFNDTTIFLIYAAIINVVTFVIYGLDKWKAQHSKWRIPEATLLALAVIGGSVGAWFAMSAWRHKTQHKKFRYGVPLIAIIHFFILLIALNG